MKKCICLQNCVACSETHSALLNPAHSLPVGCKEVQAVVKQSSPSIALRSLELLFPGACDTVIVKENLKYMLTLHMGGL